MSKHKSTDYKLGLVS